MEIIVQAVRGIKVNPSCPDNVACMRVEEMLIKSV